MASYYANTAKGEAGAALDARYAEIKAAQAKQQAHYANWLASGTVNCGALEETAALSGQQQGPPIPEQHRRDQDPRPFRAARAD